MLRRIIIVGIVLAIFASGVTVGRINRTNIAEADPTCDIPAESKINSINVVMEDRNPFYSAKISIAGSETLNVVCITCYGQNLVFGMVKD